MPEPKEYRHIWAWGQFMGSFDYYIEDQQEKAAQSGAPLDATYFSITDKRWHTIGECKNPEAVEFVNKVLSR